jgi:hypothetical protein
LIGTAPGNQGVPHRREDAPMSLAIFAALLFAASLHSGWKAVVKRGLDRLS